MQDIFEKIHGKINAEYLEFRFHRKLYTVLVITKEHFEIKSYGDFSGVGVRILKNGAWGFASTSSFRYEKIMECAERALKIAEVSSQIKKKSIELSGGNLATGYFKTPGYEDILNTGIEDKANFIKEINKDILSSGADSTKVFYREALEERIIWTSDGANTKINLSKPEITTIAYVKKDGEIVDNIFGVGINGSWKSLIKKFPENFGENFAKETKKIANAEHPPGGMANVILEPSVVGLLAHEAIGHTVEGDMVLTGCATTGKLGKRVASELITLVDSGDEGEAAGTIYVDDEGVIAGKTVVIDKGILKSYLLDRERAKVFGVESTGNARAYEYSDIPLIRMRNTYIERGEWKKDEIIEDTRHGFLLSGARGGQADSNAEFMFGISKVYEIKNGSIEKLYRGTTLTGNAFEVLSNVDAVSREFEFAMGYGQCGKWQPAKVDGGGPYLRTIALLGGM